MKEIVFLPAGEITDKIRSGELSVVETVGAFLAQIKKHEPDINAITHLRDEEEILKEARHKDELLKSKQPVGPLHGLPMTVKDSFDVEGLITSIGHPLFSRNIAKEDAILVQRLKEAGAIIIGKTNLPLFSIDWQSTNWWFGQTNNPYKLERVAGGSSGGSSAALAAGFTPLELGSDIGGSIRVPAHFCGVCGLKPTEKALPNRGQSKFPGKPQGHRNLLVSGPMARSVDDLMLAMKVLWNHDKPLSEIPPVDFNRTSWEGTRLRIAYNTTINEVDLDKEYLAVFNSFIDKIKQEEHRLSLDFPKYNEKQAFITAGILAGYDFDINMPQLPLRKAFLYSFIRLKFRAKYWAKGMAKGVRISPRDYAKALNDKDRLSDLYTNFFRDYDIWLTPVCAIEAFKHQRAGKAFRINSRKVSYMDAIASFTFTTALSGHPIAVIPIGFTSSGMPVGVQIHAQKWHDKKLLEIARYLEKFTPRFRIPNGMGRAGSIKTPL